MADVVITQPIHPDEVERLRATGHEVRALDSPTGLSGERLRTACRDSRVLLCQLTDRVDEDVLAEHALELVATVSVGFDHVDVNAARRYSVTVTHTPDVLTDATADMTFALLFALARQVTVSDRDLRAGVRTPWQLLPERMGSDLTGATIGIVGLGRIGRAVARRARFGFGMQVLYTSTPRSTAPPELEATRVDLADLLARSDIVTLHAPITDETRHLINARTLRLMQPHALLINTGRGALIDEADLAEALEAGVIAGAGLDVFEHEPDVHEGLVALQDRCVLTPHIASATAGTRRAMVHTAIDDVLAHLAGRPPRHVVAGGAGDLGSINAAAGAG